MILGNQVEWALHCVVVLAGQPDLCIPAKVLAEFHDVPRDYLAKAMQKLAAAGLVATRPGPAGGYRLARAPENITVLDVVLAVEGDAPSFQCTEIRKCGPCRQPPESYSPVCRIAAIMARADAAWRAELRGQTIAGIAGSLNRDLPAAAQQQFTDWLGDRSARA